MGSIDPIAMSEQARKGADASLLISNFEVLSITAHHEDGAAIHLFTHDSYHWERYQRVLDFATGMGSTLENDPPHNRAFFLHNDVTFFIVMDYEILCKELAA